MSIVILGGNECMERRYKEMCKSYQHKAKVYTKASRSLDNIGCPDLLVVFTDTISHKMVQRAMSETKGRGVRIARSHSSSMNALKAILEEHSAVMA